MHFSTLLAAGVVFLGSAMKVTADVDATIKFHKWQNYDCSGEEAGDDDKIEDGHCWSFQHTFTSYMIKKPWFNLMMFWHNDWSNPGCSVIIYPEPNCAGQGWSAGTLDSTMQACVQVPHEGFGHGHGHSAAVLCGQVGPVAGYVNGPEYHEDLKLAHTSLDTEEESFEEMDREEALPQASP